MTSVRVRPCPSPPVSDDAHPCGASRQGSGGIWLVAQREARGKGQTETFEALRKLPEFGWGPDSRASYSKWEYGQGEPDSAQQAALLRFYGAEPPTDEASPGERDGPGDALIRAIAEQTAALTELASQVRRLVDRDPQTAALTADLVALAIRETLQDVGLVERTRRP